MIMAYSLLVVIAAMLFGIHKLSLSWMNSYVAMLRKMPN